MLIINKKHTQVVNVNPAFQSYYFFTDNTGGKFRIMCNVTSDGSATPAVKVAEYNSLTEQTASFEGLLEILKENPEVVDFLQV